MTPSEWKSKLARLLRLLILAAVASYFGIILYGALSITIELTIPLKSTVCCLEEQHEDIHFQTADGLTLSGWYIPPKNGAVIILFHFYYGNRRSMLPVADMLTRHGYGVLMYDQRASGESQGEVRSLGWLDIPDVRLAVALAQSRPGVDKTVSASTAARWAAPSPWLPRAQNPSIAAVAADAPSPLSFGEAHPQIGAPDWEINLPVTALYYSFVALRAWTQPPTTTHAAVQSIAPARCCLFPAASLANVTASPRSTTWPGSQKRIGTSPKPVTAAAHPPALANMSNTWWNFSMQHF